MSNFGQLGTQTVNMYNSLSRENRAQQGFEDTAPQRELGAKMADINTGILNAEIELEGGRPAYERMRAKEEALKRDTAAKNAQANLQYKRAQASKLGRDALAKSVRSAATAGQTGTSTVTAYQRGAN